MSVSTLDRLAALDASATPGPWWSENEPNSYVFAANNASGTVLFTRTFASSDDGVLVAESRNALPALIAVARAAQFLSGDLLPGFSNYDDPHQRNLDRLRRALAALEAE